MTLKDLIEEKIESARRDIERYGVLEKEHIARLGGSSILYEKRVSRLEGEIEAYQDILAVLRSGKYEQR